MPLIAHDPYFSIWSFADKLNGENTKHWTGKPNGMSSLLRVDGKTYRVMGQDPRQLPELPQQSVRVLPTRTVYEFEGAGVHLTLTFLSPLLPDDLDLLSRPASYITWSVRSTDGAAHAASLYFDASASIAVNTTDQPVTAGRFDVAGLHALRAGSQTQAVLNRAGDDLRIDWGYLYLVPMESAGLRTSIARNRDSMEAFTEKGTLPDSDYLDFPRLASERGGASVLAAAYDLGPVKSEAVTRTVVLAYDDVFSIEFFYRKLRPYWRRNGAAGADLLRDAVSQFASIRQRAERFDNELMKDMNQSGGKAYAELGALSYRQALAAQKLVADLNGTPLLFSKENFSNGCTGTVDVIYPAAPQLMLLNTELFKASLTPVLEYAISGRWKFPFAPHDLGTYPLANGQVYGGGEKTEENQMPVEESANMLILVDWVARVEGNTKYVEKYWKPLSEWAAYLESKGLDPENQLCTDDFAGHLAHNANLSAKAIVALGSWADLCKRAGKSADAARYRATAETFAHKWVTMAADGDHYKLTFDKPGTWSQKYNLVWDRLLGLKLFPESVTEKEIAYYKTKLTQFGLPLDSRRDYTKLDWTVWTATMAKSRADFETIASPLVVWANETPTRVPLTDWYSTGSGKQEGFQARSVVGGVFIKMLDDEALVKKWTGQKK